ncbi:alpha/beta fold hydrolase [Spirillospora sp. CA-294931]|uniref:alpha/beta fold hydrolase n=1 Tax=Spirillospora sp. CA-294931 TaxID=3240042 RepID=UPI003D93E7E5
MATFVLVPGYWLGAWAWDEVAAELRAAGHEVRAVTLTGMAERSGEAAPEVDVDTHVGDLVRLIEGDDLREVVLVGHSGANMAVTGAADRVPERVARIVYVDTAPMPSGLAGIDFYDPDERAELEALVQSEGEGWKIPVPPLDPAVDPRVGGLTEQHLAAIRDRGTPQPFGTATQALTRPVPLPDVPKTLIMNMIPIATVLQLAASGNPVFGALTGPEWSYLDLPTGHWPMFSRPKELAELLAGLA